jgi:putative phosphoesterase
VIRLLLISDTHLPRRAKDLPALVWSAAEAADVVIHAGDWCEAGLLDDLERRTRRVIGVVGNNDGPELAARLPEVARAELGGLRVAVVHDSGPAAGREGRCAAAFPDADLLVFGHSHIPWDTAAGSGPRLINPGSPTDRRRQPFGTYVTAAVSGGELVDVVFHQVPRTP